MIEADILSDHWNSGTTVGFHVSAHSYTMVATVVIADDCAPFRRLLSELLEESPGFRVVAEAADGIAAVQLTEELRPSIVLLDIAMPWMNGFDAARKTARTSPASRVIFVTENSDVEIARTAFQIGARGYVLKASLEELLAAAEAVMRGNTFVSKILRPHLLSPFAD